MGNYELIQQKIYGSAKPQNQTAYILTMYIKLAGDNIGQNFLPAYDSELKIYLAKNEIKYKSESDFDDVCTNKYIEHQVGLLQDILEVANIELSLTSMPFNSGWHKIERVMNFDYISSVDWFAIETRKKNYTGNPFVSNCEDNLYVAIDDVSLVPVCEHPCAPSLGQISSYVSNAVNTTQPFVANINNAMGYRLDIKNEYGEVFISRTEFDPNGLSDFNLAPNSWRVYWDGRDNYGIPVQFDIYPYSWICL